MHSARHAFYRAADYLREIVLTALLSLPQLNLRRSKPRQIDVVASLTSYPPRIGKAWIAIETLLRQSVKPIAVVLVLSEEEFPGGRLPRRIEKQTKRGLHILWVAQNGRSYDKLLPTQAQYPGKTIVTFDDDKFFPPQLLEQLHAASQENPGTIIGSRGWVIQRDDSHSVRYGVNWQRAPFGAQGFNLLTPGGNGCLYPPSALHAQASDVQEALKVCPTADDLWFWGAALKNGTSHFCLGLKAHRPVRGQKSTIALSDVNREKNDNQFQAVLDYFEIRDALNHVIS